MKVGLIGYGKMGREVERIAALNGHTIVHTFDIDRPLEIRLLSEADVWIDFSTPERVVEHMRAAAEEGADIVVGTTGWYDRLEEVRGWFSASAMLYAHNFSIGMNIFYRVVRQAARLLDPQPQFDAYIVEIHNRDKVDAPSGTALRLGEIVLEEVDRKSRLVRGTPEGGLGPDALQITSVRAGTVPGAHTVAFDSDADTIELRHASKTRAGFAMGALAAARWVHGRKGVFTLDDMIDADRGGT